MNLKICLRRFFLSSSSSSSAALRVRSDSSAAETAERDGVCMSWSLSAMLQEEDYRQTSTRAKSSSSS
jgi:hypothetical protein